MHRPPHRRRNDEARMALGRAPGADFEGQREGCNGWVALAMMAVSAVMGAASKQQAADATKKAETYKAAVARNNEIVAEQNAKYAEQKGQAGEEVKRQKTAQMIGQERAHMGASGLTVESESGVRLYGDTAQMGEIDALTIRNNSAREAYGWRSQGVNYEAEARLDEMRAKQAEEAGNLGVMSSLMGGASQVSDKWSQFSSAGGGSFAS